VLKVKIRGLNLPGTPRATSACRKIPVLLLLLLIKIMRRRRRRLSSALLLLSSSLF
jgi:hypothetical protein